MREIKFRAWDTVYEYMIYLGSIEDIFNNCNSGSYCLAEREVTADIDNLIIMQYTGLKDKNGKEIYEGDIIKQKFRETQYGIIQWVEHCFWIVEPSGTRHMPSIENREVIGNIHENPERGEK